MTKLNLKENSKIIGENWRARLLKQETNCALYGLPGLAIAKACFNSLLATAIKASFLLLPLATILS